MLSEEEEVMNTGLAPVGFRLGDNNRSNHVWRVTDFAAIGDNYEAHCKPFLEFMAGRDEILPEDIRAYFRDLKNDTRYSTNTKRVRR